MSDDDLNMEIARLEKLRAVVVPICGARPLTIPRSLWNEAWMAYAKEYRPHRAQYARILNEGFYAEELDKLRPGWRPTAQEIEHLRMQLILIGAREVFGIGDTGIGLG
jgi:hypothetical protein